MFYDYSAIRLNTLRIFIKNNWIYTEDEKKDSILLI